MSNWLRFLVWLGMAFLCAVNLVIAIIALCLASKAKHYALVSMIVSALTILPLFLCTISFSGDPSTQRYAGEHIDLSTVARNNILGADQGWKSSIAVVERDSFGRTLFVFYGSSSTANEKPDGSDGYVYAILIAQRTRGFWVYYYPDNNYLIYKANDWYASYPRYPDAGEMRGFAQEPGIAQDIAWLKEANDWEQPLDESRWFGVRISRWDKEQDTDGGLVSRQAKERVLEYLGAQDDAQGGASWWDFQYLSSDSFGRVIYFLRVEHSTESGGQRVSGILPYHVQGRWLL